MFLNLGHTKLEVYSITRSLCLECYKVTRLFPSEERFALVQQIRRAATSVHLNLTEGCSRKSPAERNRFFEISRGSIIEIDGAIGIAFDLEYLKMDEIEPLGKLIVSGFRLISGMIKQ